MLKNNYHFRPFDFFAYLCWGCLIFVIEMFFVIAPITSSFIHMALVMMLSVSGALFNFIRYPLRNRHLDIFLISFIIFHIFVSVRALMTGTSRSYTDLLFYWFGLIIVCCAGSFTMDNIQTERFILNLLMFFGLFFSVGIFLQKAFTEIFLKYQLSLLDSVYTSSLRRQVVFHQMYTGWTTQTFAVCINLMLGIYGSLLIWEREKKKRYLAILVVMLVAFLLTGKRGPLVFMLLAYVMTTIFLSGSFDRMVRLVWKYIVFGILAAVGLLIYVTKNSSTSRNSIIRFAEMFNESSVGSDDVSNGRFELWSLALRLFRSRPILGVGWRRYHEYALTNLSEDLEAHNVYLQILAECGIIGFVMYIIPVIGGLIFTVCYLKKQSQRSSCINRLMKLSLAVQLFLLFYAVTGNTLYDYCAQICYYFVFALCMYAKKNSNISWKELWQWIKL